MLTTKINVNFLFHALLGIIATTITTAIDGHTITRSEDLISYIDDHKSVGDNVIFTVYRNGHILNLKTTLAARSSTPVYPQLMPFQLSQSSHFSAPIDLRKCIFFIIIMSIENYISCILK